MPTSKHRKNHKQKAAARTTAKKQNQQKINNLMEELKVQLQNIQDTSPEALTITGADTSRIIPAYNININEL
jgi:hypothetical protein